MNNLDTVLSISKKLCVLYVEDNEVARESTLGLLNNIFADITVAVDGEEALDKFLKDTTAYDLIISDINMPNMNGREMIQRVREVDESLIIFVLTADIEAEQKVIKNVNAYLRKPIDFMKLLMELEKNF
jgi:CheY-like chemotaxis protein